MSSKAKVFLRFATAPLLGGFVFGLVINFITLLALIHRPGILQGMYPGEGFLLMIAYPILAEVLFLLPSLLTAWIAILLKLSCSLRGCLTAGLIGGVTAAAWYLGWLLWFQRNTPLNLLPSLLEGIAAFVGTVLVCTVVSGYSLPAAAGQPNQVGDSAPVP